MSTQLKAVKPISEFRDAPRASYETPLFAILDAIIAMALPGETRIETAERCMVNEALHKTQGRQTEAAALLEISPRELNYRAARAGVRPVDKKGGAA
jgi:transcriptional regulator with GAF, ATPase, and Fis domain